MAYVICTNTGSMHRSSVTPCCVARTFPACLLHSASVSVVCSPPHYFLLAALFSSKAFARPLDSSSVLT